MSEMSIERLRVSFFNRIMEIPHWFTWHTSSLSRLNKNRILRYRNVHAGERCFIVANGPSLKKTNLDLLNGEITFGMNRIYLYFSEISFRPTYYVAMNELILEQFSHEIKKLSAPMFLNWNRRSFFCENKDERISFLKSKMTIKDYFQYDITAPTVIGGTVTFAALQIAYYMGFHEVILVGLDHNYVEKGIPNKTEIRVEDKDQSHFHPLYFPKGSKWQLPDILRSEVDYSLARKAFEADGRKVYDATIGGKCEIFEKKSYQSFFESD